MIRTLQLLLLGAALGFSGAFVACGSTPSCDITSCPFGCCDASGVCQSGAEPRACGQRGQACSMCALNELCQLGVCAAPTTGSGGGTGAGGGASTGGGNTTGGGAATGGGTATGGGSGLSVEQQEWVTAHNTARANAMPVPSPALPDVSWNAAAEALAREWARGCVFEHRQNNTMGENLFASTNLRTPTMVTDSWVSEVADYNYANNSCASGAQCGHYTQVVWRTSTGIGCATQQCTTGSPFGGGTWYLMVCNYTPAGNFIGRKPY